jgi:Fe2+ or Zn2+ uptake regulation protein
MSQKHSEIERADSLASYEQRLREAGQFVTVQRRAILRCLLRHREHPTTAQIASSIGKSGSANLALFADLGIVHAVRAPDGEVRWDLRTGPHHHMTCEGCGHIADIEHGTAEVTVRDPELRQRVSRSEVWLVGRCPRCR